MSSPNLIPVPCGPLTLEFLGHSTPESFDREAGYSGACLETALRSIANGYTILRFDKSISPYLASASGVARGVNQKQTEIEKARRGEHAKEIYESFPRYLNRIKAKVSPELWKEILTEVISQSRSFRISSAPTRVTPLEAKFLKRATALLTQELVEINDQVSTLFAVVGDYPLARDSDGKPELESLARLMQHTHNTILNNDD